ncbi:hypothetical protein NQ315_005126 [Exocentrus adspersus]|uniref:HTH psq-type domain-containing protein n=1 Tax=Exocentrus adspersus TaxID=1586481 RepID=A0AAV8VTW6_9CUCU|nr:hypothetical protein NQ315_005126 [Exocentrus adspersus]
MQVSKYFATGTVKDVQRGGGTHVSEETKLNVLLKVQENPHCSTRQIGLNDNIDRSTVVKLLKKEEYRPYNQLSSPTTKMVIFPTNEFDFNKMEPLPIMV